MNGLVIITVILFAVLLIGGFVLYQQQWRSVVEHELDDAPRSCHVELDPYHNNAEFVLPVESSGMHLRAERASGMGSKLRGFFGGGHERTLDNGELWYFVASPRAEKRLRDDETFSALQGVLKEGQYMRLGEEKLFFVTSLSRYGRANNPDEELLKKTIRTLVDLSEALHDDTDEADK